MSDLQAFLCSYVQAFAQALKSRTSFRAVAMWETDRQPEVAAASLCCIRRGLRTAAETLKVTPLHLQDEKFQSAPGSKVGTPAYLAPEVISTTRGRTYNGMVRDGGLL